MQNTFGELSKIFESNEKYVITTHVTPDGDAVGSVLALGNYLRQKNKDVKIINHSVTPDNLSFLDNYNSIEFFPGNESKLKEYIHNADVIIILDANEFSRTRSLEEYIVNSPAKKICIDHHQGINGSNFYFILSDTGYAATCQLIYDYIIFDNSSYINKDIANYLYAGIMTDTGSFRFPRTTSTVLRICADLIDKGADPVELYDKIYNTVTKNKLDLLKRFLNSLEYEYNDSMVISTITEKDLNECNAEPNDVEGFTSYLMSIDNVKLGLLIAEMPKLIKVSIRSKGNIPANELANEFGGGGHLNAAGISLERMNVNELKKDLTLKAKKYINQ